MISSKPFHGRIARRLYSPCCREISLIIHRRGCVVLRVLSYSIVEVYLAPRPPRKPNFSPTTAVVQITQLVLCRCFPPPLPRQAVPASQRSGKHRPSGWLQSARRLGLVS
ncbi:unnamed protein product [Laminaria digitata]